MADAIVITGTGGGIGAATVAALAAPDRHLLCVDVAAHELERLTAGALPGRPMLHASSLDTVMTCREAVAAAQGPVAGLVRLAGVFEPDPAGIGDMGVFERAAARNLTNGYMLAGAVMERAATRAAARWWSPPPSPCAAARGSPCPTPPPGADSWA